jgi:hypothetical protein
MSVPRALLDAVARAALDRIDLPLTIATSVRDRDGRLLDFRLEFANLAATTWAGLPDGAMTGRLITDLIPSLRPTGLYDALAEVVASGQPFRQGGRPYEGSVEEGRAFSAVFDLFACRLGDGYLSLWTEGLDQDGTADLEAIAGRVTTMVPMVRLEATANAPLRLEPA